MGSGRRVKLLGFLRRLFCRAPSAALRALSLARPTTLQARRRLQARSVSQRRSVRHKGGKRGQGAWAVATCHPSFAMLLPLLRYSVAAAARAVPPQDATARTRSPCVSVSVRRGRRLEV